MSIQAAGFRYIPKGAIKVADKKSDAVAYLFPSQTGNGKPAMKVFYGKQSKPVAYFVYPDEAQRAKRIAEYFKARQERQARKDAEKAQRAAQTRGVEVGQFMAASWGYDQTNVNFYKVTKLIGETMAEVVAVGQIDVGAKEGGASMSTNVIPMEEPKDGAKTYKVRVKAGAASINGNYASVWDGKPKYCSWYA